MNQFVTGFRINFKREKRLSSKGTEVQRDKGTESQGSKEKTFVPLYLCTFEPLENIEILNFVSYRFSNKGMKFHVFIPFVFFEERFKATK